MSQYPRPQGPIFDNARPTEAPLKPLLGPARRASVLMFILGGLCVAFGLCFGAAGWIMPINFVTQASGLDPAQLEKIESNGVSVAGFLHLVFTCAGVMAVVAGVCMLALGAKVRRGGRGATVAALVICGLIVLYLVVNFAVVTGRFLGHPDAALAVNLVLPVAIVVAFGLLLAWLFQALQACARVQSLETYYQGQFDMGTPRSPAGIAPLTAPPQDVVGPAAPNASGGSERPISASPPSGQSPPRYGYAQAPAIPQPPPGDTPIGTTPPGFPSAPGPGPSPDRADADERD